MAKVQRRIGIDYGTSTSVVYYKDYPGGKVTDAEPPNTVRFGKWGTATVPTLVLTDELGRPFKFGHEAAAEAEHLGDQVYGYHLHSEFKMGLVDPETLADARILTVAFLRYLYERYRDQATRPEGLEEQTLIGYPAKWPSPLRELTVELAREAGFPNVVGLDEPSAALQYFAGVRDRSVDDLFARGLFVNGRPVHVLLIDLGAGTTDLVLYRYVPGSGTQEELAVWPSSDQARNQDANFGGRELDRHLFDRVVTPVFYDRLKQEDKEHLQNRVLRMCKEWKENEVSQQFERDQVVTRLFSDALAFIRPMPNPNLSRASFERLFEDYLEKFARLVCGIVDHAVAHQRIRGGQDVDLVVLTGGHSQWYFVNKILTGELRPKEVEVQFDKIRQDPSRIVRTALPQETVAHGLSTAGINLRKVAAHKAWLQLKIGETEIRPIEIHAHGQSLPTSKTVFFRDIRFRYIVGEPIVVECHLVVGETVDTGDVYQQLHATPIEYKGFLSKVGDFVGGVLIPDWENERVNRAHLYLTIQVDAYERFEVAGMVKTNKPGVHPAFLAIGRELPTQAEQRTLKLNYKQQSGAFWWD